jgi:hypothetical protein
LLTLLALLCFGALPHALVHRLKPAHQITRLVRCLRLLSLTIAPLRSGLRLLESLSEIGNVAGDLRLH